MKPLTYGELFAGIGGIGLGFEAAGGGGMFVPKWQVERDDYAVKVLIKNWPDVPKFDDVRTFPPEDGSEYQVDVIAGGFPCQDISIAGKGAGLKGERSGLFFEIVRIAERLRPKYLVLENVPAILISGRGMDSVLRELAQVRGVNNEPHFRRMEYHCIPASAVGAYHRRDRVFIIAYAEHTRPHRDRENEQKRERKEMERGELARGNGGDRDVADTDRDGRLENAKRKSVEGSPAGFGIRQTEERPQDVHTDPGGARRQGSGVESFLGIEELQRQLEGRRSDVGRRQWEIEPEVGRVANGFPGRVDQLRCLGNAVVPQVAQFIGELILRVENDR